MGRPKKVIRSKRIYKKHRFPRKALSRILFFLLIAILIGIGFIVMREWSLRFGKNAPPPSSSTPISSDAGVSSSGSVPIESEPSSEETPITAGLGKVANLSAKDLTEGLAAIEARLAALKAEGYAAVALELKTEDGTIAYRTANAMAQQYGVISESAIELNALVTAVNNAGLTPVARISTLKDAKAPHVSRDNSYAYGSELTTNWLDNSVKLGGKPWLNPYMDNARGYITELAKEINGAGIKTILLDNVMFPDQYTAKMNTIKTTPSRAEILNQLVMEVQAAVPDANVVRGVQAVAAATNEEQTFVNVVNTAVSKDIALYLNLDSIESKKEIICTKNAMIDQNGYDKTIASATVAGYLIDQAQANVDGRIIPVILQKDFAQMQPILEQYKITDFIIL